MKCADSVRRADPRQNDFRATSNSNRTMRCNSANSHLIVGTEDLYIDLDRDTGRRNPQKRIVVKRIVTEYTIFPDQLFSKLSNMLLAPHGPMHPGSRKEPYPVFGDTRI